MRRVPTVVSFLFAATSSFAPAVTAVAMPQIIAEPLLRVRIHGQADVTSPTGMTPAALKAAYGFSTSASAGGGKTIALVDAYDDPQAEADLNTFSTQFGLPPCTVANGCFTKVNQSGGASLPPADSGWALEIALDIEWAHAVAPGAKILLVEATSASLGNLLAAESYAKAHAGYVSNSWGTGEFFFESFYDSSFKATGVSVFAASGDSGSPAIWPATSPNVIAVGGTTLTLNADGSVASETGWSGSGGGCSKYEKATTAQSGFGQYPSAGCQGKRATPDVALNADPNTGVAVYDSFAYNGQTGWWQVGGTSASSPMWAARSADAGALVNATYVYGSAITYRDITVGSNGGFSCRPGFDLVTGRGSWTGATP